MHQRSTQVEQTSKLQIYVVLSGGKLQGGRQVWLSAMDNINNLIHSVT